MKTLFNAATTNGNSDSFIEAVTDQFTFVVSGTLGGGTVALEVKNPIDSAWVPLTSVTAVGATVVTLTANSEVRASMTGATTPNFSVAIV